MSKIPGDLDEAGFRRFQRFLRGPANLDGQEQLGTALLQNKDRMDTGDVILQSFPDNVDQIMGKVLWEVGGLDLQF